MLNTETVVSTAIKIPFVSENNDTGITTFDTMILRDGVLYTSMVVPVTFTEIGEGLYTLNATFTETGLYTLFIEQNICAYITVRDRTFLSYLVNLEDEALGSWEWNKATNLLTLYRISGGVLSTFNMSDSTVAASRAISI